MSFAQNDPNLNQKLLDAVVKRQTDVALDSIARGANVNLKTKKGLPLINIAAFHRQTRIVKAMIEHSVNPHIKDKNGATAIVVASMKGRLPIVQLLTD